MSALRIWATAMLVAVLSLATAAPLCAAEVAAFDYRVVGVQLEVSPAALSVPKGVAGSLNVRLLAGADGAAGDLGDGAWVEGILRGPSLPARRVVGRPNEPLLLPALASSGDYQLDSIRLVDAATGATRLEGSPSSVPIRVFDDVLVARVTSRPLTGDEIREKGIFIDDKNFRAVEFEISFALQGGTVSVRYPVIAPVFPDPAVQFTDPAREAELIKFAEEMNRQNFANIEFPDSLQQASLDLQVRPMVLKFAQQRPPGLPPYSPPPLAGLLIIPGNIGFLNQFFAVQVYVENAAPATSGLSVTEVRAELVLPVGEDRVVGSYDVPGDDPLRFARLGPTAQIFSSLPIARPGADGVSGTRDDVGRLLPREGAQAEFLVEGLREGLHIIDVNLTGTLEGLAAGPVEISGVAAGSVFVRNPRFAVSFTHPRTVRVGEAYTASVTIFNTGSSHANSVTLTLPGNTLSGTRLEPGQAETIALGDIAPGESRTADYRMRSQRTGYVAFSNFESKDGVQGVFRFRSGVDERGVELSPDSLAYPDHVDALPTEVFRAANRVLGQALGAAQRGLPSGILPVDRATIEAHMRELIEAGQRLKLGDTPERVFTDLILDWQGLRAGDNGFDQLLRTTEAGREWRNAVHAAAYPIAGNAATRLSGRAADFAGLGGAFWAGAASDPLLAAGVISGRGRAATAENSGVANALVYRGAGGETTAVFLGTPQLDFMWTALAASTTADVVLLDVRTDGRTIRRTWTVGPLVAGTVLRYSPGFGADVLNLDANADGFPESTLAPVLATIVETPPRVLLAMQDLSVLYARPGNPSANSPGFCDQKPYYDPINELYYLNYGMIVALLYNKPIDVEGVGSPAFYALDNGVRSGAIKLQKGTRVAYLGLEQGVGIFRNRNLVISGGQDPRGNALVRETIPVETVALAGAPLRGRVIRGDNSAGAFLPVTLTYVEHFPFPDCPPYPVRAVQTLTDAQGEFEFDFVMGGVGYRLDVVDVTGLGPDVARLLSDAATDPAQMRERLAELSTRPGIGTRLLEDFGVADLPAAFTLAQSLDRASFGDTISTGKEGVQQVVVLRFRGRGSLLGTVVMADGETPLTGVPVTYFPPATSGENEFTVLSDSSGRFAFIGVPLGPFALQGISLDRRQQGAIFDALLQPGGVLDVTLPLQPIAVPPPLETVSGRVFLADGVTPAAYGAVLLRHASLQSWRADCDADGNFSFPEIPIGNIALFAIDAERRQSAFDTGKRVEPGAPNYFTMRMRPGGNASVRVVWSIDKRPVANALVSGGRELVRTDANGTALLVDVQTGGEVTVVAGIEADPARGIPFPRVGSTRTGFQPGNDNFVQVELAPEGGLFGTVFDPDGQVAAGVEVALAYGGSFASAVTDANGRYEFNNLELKTWNVSAPAPPEAERKPATGDPLEDQLRELASSLDVNALQRPGAAQALVETIIALARNDVAAPAQEGERLELPPLWGYASKTLIADSVLARADIHMLRRVSAAGRVINPQGTPVGADVEVSGVVPSTGGAPHSAIIARMKSDPGTGRWSFPDVFYAGTVPQPFKFVAYSPFFPQPALFEGQLTTAGPDVSNVLLQFVATEAKGKLGITVVDPNGQPVGADVPIWISYLGDYEIRTDANGHAETINLPASNYTIEAGLRKPYAGPVGIAVGGVKPGITTEVTVSLLARGDLAVRVEFTSGVPAAGARVRVQQGGFPALGYDLVTDANGNASLTDVYAGEYSLSADASTASQRLRGSGSVEVTGGLETPVTIRLQPSGRVTGRFVRSDGVTPVDGAMIGIAAPGATIFTPTDTAGNFSADGVALGSLSLHAVSPVTGLHASGSATLSFEGQTIFVTLVEETLGTVTGLVIAGDGITPVAAAQVHMRLSRTPQEPTRTVLTGADGRFTFGGVPPAGFGLTAVVDLPVRNIGEAAGELAAGQTRVEVNIRLSGRGAVEFLVLQPDGQPAFPAEVRFGSPVNTNSAGIAVVEDVHVGFAQTFTARSLADAEDNSAAEGSVRLDHAGERRQVTVRLSGVGRIAGVALQSPGGAPLAAAPVTMRSTSGIGGSDQRVVLSGADGSFAFGNIGIGNYDLSTNALGLRGSISGSITASGEADDVVLALESSGAVRGRLVVADGSAPMAGQPVVLAVENAVGRPGIILTRITGADGRFEFDSVRLANWELDTESVTTLGRVLRRGALTTNGQILDLGDLRLDEVPPTVLSSAPASGEETVATTGPFRVDFSEPIDPLSLDREGIYLATNASVRVPATLALTNGPGGTGASVVITPSQPLAQQTAYQLVAIDGDRTDLGGSVTALGPRDVNGLPLATALQIGFRTADENPPLVTSVFPLHNTEQVDPVTVPRLSFNEAISPTGITATLNGPGGAVAGTLAIVLNGQALNFTPTVALPLNASFTFTVSGIRDLAGNALAAQPVVTSFQTLDTLGPVITALDLAGGATPVGGATVTVVATIVQPELGARLRLSMNGAVVGENTTPDDLDLPVTLPVSGTVTLQGVAIDRFGNQGPLFTRTFSLSSNQPPAVTLTQIDPASGAVRTGGTFAVRVDGVDDSALSELRAVLTGAVNLPARVTSGVPIVLSGTVPASTGPGQSLVALGVATDNNGQSSGERTLTIAIADGTTPTVTIDAPPASSGFGAGTNVDLTLTATDNFGVTAVDVSVTGVFTFTNTLTFAAQPGARTVTTAIPIPAGTSNNGAAFTVSVVARDAAGLASAPVTRGFATADTAAPTNTGSSPFDGQGNTAAASIVYVYFDRPLDPATVDATTFQILDAANAPVPGVRATWNGNYYLQFTPAEPLQFDAAYTVSTTAGLRGANGVAAVAAQFTFRVAPFTIVEPVGGSLVVEGQIVHFRANGTNHSGIQNVVIVLPNGAEFTAGGPLFETDITIPTLAALGAPPHVFTARAVVSGVAQPLAPLTLTVRANGAPVAVDDTLTAQANESTTIVASTDLFANDSDPDGDALALVSFTPPTNGTTAAGGTGVIVYTPATGFTGNTTFSYTVRDPYGLSATATVSVQVGTNQRPLIPGGPGSAYALQFAGEGDRVIVADDPSLRPPVLTVEAWIYPEVVGVTYRPPVMKTTNWSDGYGFYQDYNADFQSFYVTYYNINRADSPALTANTWHHVAGTYDGATIRFYLDGGLVDSQAYAGPISHSFAELVIGGGPVGYDWLGLIDDVRVWNRARSDAEIVADFQNAEPVNRAGLVALWDFEQGTGLVANNRVGSGLDGTLSAGYLGSVPTWALSDAPLTTNSALVTEDTPAAFALPGTDPEGAPLTATLLALPLHGDLFQTTDGVTPGAPITSVPTVVTNPNRRVVYAPDPFFNGLDALRYRLHDGALDSEPGALRLFIENVPNAPVAVDDAFITPEGVQLISASVLVNDSDADPADEVGVLDFTAPANGTVTHDGAGVFRYTPAAGFTGTDSFTYRVTDGVLASGSATVTITVTPAVEFVWTNPAGGNWGTASNWDRNVVPGVSSRVRIDLPGTYTVTASADVHVIHVDLGGAGAVPTLSVQYSQFITDLGLRVRAGATVAELNSAGFGGRGGVMVEAGGTVELTGGLLVGPGVLTNAPGGNLLLHDAQIAGDIVNHGNVTLDGYSYFREGTFTTFTNASDGTMTVPSGGLFEWTDGVTGIVRNAGTLVKNTDDSYQVNIPFENTGTVTVQEGTLFLGDGSSANDIAIAAGADLNFRDGVFTFAAGTGPSGAGNVSVQSSGEMTIPRLAVTGTLTSNYTPLTVESVAPGATFAAVIFGAVAFNSDVTITNLTLASGSLGGPGMVTVTGSSSWISTYLLPGGDLIFAPGSTLTLESSTRRIERRVVNHGTMRHIAGNTYLSNTEWLNAADGTFIAEGGQFSQWSAEETRLFTNAGTFRKQASTLFTLDYTVLASTGSLVIEAGNLSLGGGGTIAQSLTVVAGSTLTVLRDVVTFAPGATLGGAGALILSSSGSVACETFAVTGTTTLSSNGSLSATTFTTPLNVVQNSGVLTLGGPATFATWSFAGGIVDGPGAITVAGSMNWSNGEMDGDGACTFASGSLVTVGSGSARTFRDIENFGHIVVQTGTLYLRDATLFNRAGALLEFEAGGSSRWSGGETGLIRNESTLVKRTTALSTLTLISLENTGAISVQDGELRFSSSPLTSIGVDALLELAGGDVRFFQPQTLAAGVVQGAGTIFGNVTNSATVRPGGAVGSLNLSGTFTQTAAGRLEIQLGGTPASGLNDRLVITSSATLGGTLAVSLANGHTPAQGDIYTALTYASRTGNFTTFEGLDQTGVSFAPTVGTTSYTLNAGPPVGGSQPPTVLGGNSPTAETPDTADGTGPTAGEASNARTRLVNLSARAFAASGDGAVITGFVISGSQSKTVLVRAVGPGLAPYGVQDFVAAPQLRIYQGNTPVFDGQPMATAPNRDAILAAATTAGAFALDPDGLDVVAFVTLPPGAYTAHATGAASPDSGQGGVALVEVYDVTSTTAGGLLNLSSRAEVRPGERVLIAGFVIQGDAPKRVMIRGVGPGLAAYTVSGWLAHPRLTLRHHEAIVGVNEGWDGAPGSAALAAAATTLNAFPLGAASADAALLVELAPGIYTVEVSATDGGSGVALVEVYDADGVQ